MPIYGYLWVIFPRENMVLYNFSLFQGGLARAAGTTMPWVVSLGPTSPFSTTGGFMVILPFGKLTWLWKITILNRKTHYKWPFSIAI